ncbi:(Fe-S)-binding protein [Chloroflexota bacterium]
MDFILNETYLGISGYLIFWVFFAAALFIFLRRALTLIRLLRLGRPISRPGKLIPRLKIMLIETFSQRCSLKHVTRNDFAGLGHALLFWSFIIFFLYYVIFVFIAVGLNLRKFIMGGTFELISYTILDFAGGIVLFAVLWALVRRYINKPKRLEQKPEAAIILALIFSLMVFHFITEGIGYAILHSPSFWPPIGNAIGYLVAATGISSDSLLVIYGWSWWIHYFILLGFLIYILYSKHLHIIAIFPNIFLKSMGLKGAITPIDFKEYQGTFGVENFRDFTWKQILDFYACTECGRCNDVCPAVNSGKILSPREMIQHLKNNLLQNGPSLIKDNIEHIAPLITPQELWDCTTCLACQEVCPASIEHLDTIMDLRKNLVMEKAEIPEQIAAALESFEERGHPWPRSEISRHELTSELNAINTPVSSGEIDTLYWVGCNLFFNERGHDIARAMVKILKSAGTNYTILGELESCCGDPVRRMGHEYLFQLNVQRNIALFNNLKIKNIITSCPHCSNMFKNEYPQFGGDYKVLHHTEYIADLLHEKRLITRRNRIETKITYHDPCYLARYNNIVVQPREIINSLPGLKLVEMKENIMKSFCCGGHIAMWLDEKGDKISYQRIEQAVQTAASEIAVACPFCMTMLEDAVEAKEMKKKLRVIDLAELVADSI